MSFILETRDLVKTYGTFQAVKGMSLRVEQGAIYGFVGPNGAGKTTTMRIVTTLLEPTSGEAYVGGHSVRTAADERPFIQRLRDHGRFRRALIATAARSQNVPNVMPAASTATSASSGPTTDTMNMSK